MKLFEFELTFKLADPEQNPEGWLDALFEAGCDDALPSVGQHGYIALDFARRDTSAQKAMSSAIKDVEKAIPGAELIETKAVWVKEAIDYIDALSVDELENEFSERGYQPVRLEVGSDSYRNSAFIVSCKQEGLSSREFVERASVFHIGARSRVLEWPKI